MSEHGAELSGTWYRIGDDDVAAFGCHEWTFEFPGGVYRIGVDQQNQHAIVVSYSGEEVLWPIDLKEQRGEEFKLSGLADWIPQILDTPCWYELLVCPDPSVTYWGDREIYRIDRLLTAS